MPTSPSTLGRPRRILAPLVTGAGALVLDPVLKSLVCRRGPVVTHPIAHGIGNVQERPGDFKTICGSSGRGTLRV